MLVPVELLVSVRLCVVRVLPPKSRSTSGEEKYRFKSLVDVPDCFNEMFGFRICENCGKEFEAGPKCQRSLCEECYKKDLKNRNKIAAKKYYHNQ